jgi:hypothetical protein
MFNYVPIKHKQISLVSNGGKFKLYTVLNDLIFPTPTQPRISFEHAIVILFIEFCLPRKKSKIVNSRSERRVKCALHNCNEHQVEDEIQKHPECSFKFPVKIGFEESIVNAPRITNCDQLFKFNLTLALFVFLPCKLMTD